MSRTGYVWVFVVASIVIASAVGGVALWTDVAKGAPPNAPLGFTLGPVPVALSFQGELADTAGKPLSGKYNMRFAIF